MLGAVLARTEAVFGETGAGALEEEALPIPPSSKPNAIGNKVLWGCKASDPAVEFQASLPVAVRLGAVMPYPGTARVLAASLHF